MNLKDLVSKVTENGYHVCDFGELSLSLDFDVETLGGRFEFNNALEAVNLQTLPKITNGSVANLERSILGVPIVFYHKRAPIDRHTSSVRYALLVGRISAVLAKVDGDVDLLEIVEIKSKIYSLSFLTENEKYNVFIRSIYALYQNSSKDRLMQEFSVLKETDKLQILSIIKSIIISDKHIHKNERQILSEFYKLSGVTTKTITKDLKEYAKKQRIDLIKKNNSEDKNDYLVIDVNSALDDMLSEFESF
ncbi:co-chaperone DjlA [Aliivibrio fischeri]|uniref:co-chaperone DjlA n=1 Tax=Aliivibrio fischeri TaxID=668 RepID=UPI0007C5C32E|nr:co-chaperone DjlA [Aliivibrio fischeri]